METTGEEQTTEPTFQFSILGLLWFTTMIAIGLNTFGLASIFLLPLGMMPGVDCMVNGRTKSTLSFAVFTVLVLFLYSTTLLDEYGWRYFLATIVFVTLALAPLWQNQSLPTTSPANLSGGE